MTQIPQRMWVHYSSNTENHVSHHMISGVRDLAQAYCNLLTKPEPEYGRACSARATSQMSCSRHQRIQTCGAQNTLGADVILGSTAHGCPNPTFLGMSRCRIRIPWSP